NKDSQFRPYEKLMCLREDLEDALGMTPAPAAPSPTLNPPPMAGTKSVKKPEPLEKPKSPANLTPSAGPVAPAVAAPSPKQPNPVAPAEKSVVKAPSAIPSKESIPASEQKLPNLGAADAENLEEKIWEQLIATPPVRGRSMTTVTVQDTRVLLSAWEVAAFISASGQDSDDLRRVIVARAMLSVAIERRKRILDFKILQQAV